MRKILIVTGSRADFGLLYQPAIKLIACGEFEVGLAVTGSHLSVKHGNTIREVEKLQIPIWGKIDLSIEGDSPEEICVYMSRCLNGFSKLLADKKPDLLLILGDRYEILSAATSAMVHNVPIAHIHGGELTNGLIDDPIRHSLTKMSHIHFTSTETYAKRLIQMGEKPENVFHVGAPGLDLLKSITFMTKQELETKLGSALGKKNVLVTYHPVTQDGATTLDEVNALFSTLETLPEEYKIWIGLPNADTFSSGIRVVVKKFLNTRKDSQGFEHLGSVGYASMMKNCDILIGNSSSGIIEAPFLGKAVIDIGLRQKGRLSDKHVIRCEGTKSSIEMALRQVISPEFLEAASIPSKLYGDGHASDQIMKILQGMKFQNLLLKGFYDLK